MKSNGLTSEKSELVTLLKPTKTKKKITNPNPNKYELTFWYQVFSLMTSTSSSGKNSS
jgi:hypothetical protein